MARLRHDLVSCSFGYFSQGGDESGLQLLLTTPAGLTLKSYQGGLQPGLFFLLTLFNQSQGIDETLS